MSQILVFGASTTQGLWDLQGGWPQRLRIYLDEQFIHNKRSSKIYVFNMGVSGNSSQEILKRFEFETKQRLLHPKTLFIFSFGGNDSYVKSGSSSPRRSPKDFRKNISKIIRLAKKYSNLIVIVGLSPVDESKTCPIPWQPTISYKNAFLKQYSDIIKEVSRKEHVHFIEIFDEWIKTDYKHLLFEGLHPNSLGHQKIFEKLIAYLNSKSLISSL